MELLDIHTHHLPENPAQAIFSCLPQEFSPVPGGCYSVGLHPWYLSADYMQEWNRLVEIAKHPQVLAIGEAGLDKVVKVEMDLQQEVFIRQMELSEQTGKPLVIHSVRTANELIRLKKKYLPEMPWIIHGFRGNKNIASELVQHGFYLSFGANYREEALLAVPVERIFIETDESNADVHTLYEKAAQTLSLPYNQLLTSVQQNMKEVFFKG